MFKAHDRNWRQPVAVARDADRRHTMSRVSALVAGATWPGSQALDSPGAGRVRSNSGPSVLCLVSFAPYQPAPTKSFAVFWPRRVTLGPVYCTLAKEACRQNRNLLKARMYRQRCASLEKVNGAETVLEIPATNVALSELLAAPGESLSPLAGDAERACAAAADFLGLLCRGALEPALVRNEPGADAHRAADVVQSAFAEAFAVWERIVPACTRHVGSGW